MFDVEQDNVVTANAAVAANVVELLNGPSSRFHAWARQPLPNGLQAEIDPLAAYALRNPNGIQRGIGSSSATIRKKVSGSSETYNFILAPAPGQELNGIPNWNAMVFGPGGVTNDGVAAVPDGSDPTRVSVTVDTNVPGDVVLSVNYVDINGHSITCGPVLVVSHPPGATVSAIELLPDTITLTTGTGVSSEIWADYDNATRTRLFIPEGAAVTYSSEDASIATVDTMGIITLNAPGSTNIHVSYLGFSAQSPVTVLAPPPPPVIAALHAVSRKTHGIAGDFDIDLPFTGTPGIECRTGGASGDYQVVVTFASPITAQGASVTSGVGGVNNFIVNGSEITVNLTGVANAQTIVITLSDVSNGTTTGDITVPMSILVGDVNANGAVNASDVAQTKSRIGQPVDANKLPV